MPRLSVSRTTEFDRIAALPRRVIDFADAEAYARELTPLFRERGADVVLRPWQAYAIAEVIANRGGFLGLPVGQGKTLPSWLLPIAMQSARPALVLPAVAINSGKTWHDFRSYVGKWRMPRTPPRLFSREGLATDAQANALFEYRPDLVIVDESDELANGESACPARLDRYRLAFSDRDQVVFVTMTGTPARKSLMGFWHLLCWSLLDGAPVPLVHGEAKLWAGALDESTRALGARPHPGPLGATIKAAREWFRRRLIETPGVVIVDEDSAGDVPLIVRTRLAFEDPELDARYKRFMLDFENPGGIVVGDPLSRCMLDGQMGCGLFSYYDPEPSFEWREARRAVAKTVRDTIAHTRRSRHPLDTEGQVLRARANDSTVIEWRRVKDTFDPKRSTRFAWFSDSTLRSALAWLAEDPSPGIVWCGSVPFGRRLAELAHLPYYGREGRTAGGAGLHVADPTRSFVASWPANKRIFNLQAWRRMLIVLPPQSAKLLEQVIGRSHRADQTEAVTADILLTSGGTIDGFEAALREARFVKQTVSLTQKLLRARIVRAHPTITPSNRYRWASRTKE